MNVRQSGVSSGAGTVAIEGWQSFVVVVSVIEADGGTWHETTRASSAHVILTHTRTHIQAQTQT